MVGSNVFGIISPNRMVVWQVRSNEAEFSLYLKQRYKNTVPAFFMMFLERVPN